ncbi:hypothetical protein [Streptomyces sp. NRRL F-5630]|uniref:hypothetical protein n=1 Tax=Streptomyces sp. NRRL F-5630 TaxID=1463864 RepID=UPI0004C6C194|nr:hypothetical protein [Streptomyces sp. NRRL F-5630]
MIRETYKGRTIKITKGSQALHVRIVVNGEDLGEWVGSEVGELDWVRRTIDAVEADSRTGRPYAACWYAATA